MSFIYYNANPNGETLPDCVTRAISLALDVPYYEVISLLRDNGIFYKCRHLCVSCYEKLLDEHFQLPHYHVRTEKTVQDIIDEHPKDILLIRMDGHLSCAMFGKSYDIFDCTDELVTDFWIC